MREQREFMVHTDDVRAIWEPAKLRVIRGPRWLRPMIERAIRLLLSWSRAEIERTEKIRRFDVATGATLLGRMHLQSIDMMRLYDREARYVFVGPDVLDDLTREMRAMSLSFHEFTLMGPDGMRVLGVEVVYVPWMDGALLVPEWKKHP